MIWLQGDGELFAMKVLCKKNIAERKQVKFPVFLYVDFALRHAVVFLFCAGRAYHDRAPGAGKCVSSLYREVAPRVPV